MNQREWRKFLKSFKELDQAYKAMRRQEAHLARFTADLWFKIGTITWEYFSQKVPDSEFLEQITLEADEIHARIAADFDLQRNGIQIFDQLCHDIEDFQNDEMPVGRALRYQKIKYPEFTPAAIEERIKHYGARHQIPNPEKEEILREVFFEQAVVSEYYVNFEIRLYQELKKLTVAHFPELMEISGSGLREIDYLLYDNAYHIGERIIKLLEQ